MTPIKKYLRMKRWDRMLNWKKKSKKKKLSYVVEFHALIDEINRVIADFFLVLNEKKNVRNTNRLKNGKFHQIW